MTGRDDDSFDAVLTRARNYAVKIDRLENEATVHLARLAYLEELTARQKEELYELRGRRPRKRKE